MTHLHRFLPALAMALLPVASRAETMPRIFYTPAERSAIAQHRLRPDVPGAPDNPTETLHVDGLSVTHTGTRFAWISGHRYRDGDRLGAHRLQISTGGVFFVAATGSRFVRVGETLGSTTQYMGRKP